jgi:hypothetical protein
MQLIPCFPVRLIFLKLLLPSPIFFTYPITLSTTYPSPPPSPPPLPKTPTNISIRSYTQVQGQAGAQAIEDAAALGILFPSNFPSSPSTEDISARLQIFENMRRNRASALQMFSNAGQDELEKIRESVVPYMREGETVPGKFVHPFFLLFYGRAYRLRAEG